MTTAGRLRTFWGERQFESERLAGLTRYWEIAVFGTIVLVALGLRLWALGERAIHHDESLHMYYAWQLFEGRGYEHVPFMHGPLKFFGTALMFRLFGDNDFTARLLYALVGTVVVALPYFFRDYLGRVGAIVASLFLAFSPTMVYVSRFNRDDILIVAYTLAMVIVMWRYLEEQREKYLYFVPALLMLGFVTMEMTFITTAIFLVYLEFRIASNLLDQYRATRTLTQQQTAIAYGIFLLIGWLLSLLWPLFESPRKRWGLDVMPAAGNFWTLMFIFALPQFGPVVQQLPIPWFDGIHHLGTPHDYDEGTAHQNLKIITTLAFLFISAYIGLFWNWRIFLIGAATFYIPYFLFYTTFFTNLPGFWTGIWGSLDYWLSQQGVQRGNQPDYYYLMTSTIYEFLPMVLALGGTLYYAFKGKTEQVVIAGSTLALVTLFALIPGEAPIIGSWWQLSYIVAIAGVMLLPIERLTQFLIFWTLATMFALSVAGEKMPWLTIHIALPMIILSAKIINDILSGLGEAIREPAAANERKATSDKEASTTEGTSPAWMETIAPLVACGALAIVATIIFQAVGPASPVSILAWLLSAAALGAVVWTARTGATRMALQVAAVGLLGALFVFTVRASGTAAYDQGEPGYYPQEALIYAQGSPALNTLRDEINKIARDTGQGNDLPVVIDTTGNIWPWPWTMRDHVPGYQTSTFDENYVPPPNAILFVSQQNQANIQSHLADYNEGLPYTHMWWFPEFYRGLNRVDFLKDVFNGNLFDTWRLYFIDREVRGASAAPDMIAFFPKSYGDIVVPVGPSVPVTADQLPADQVSVIGGPGAEPGQFNAPADVTVDADGNVYVVDSLNQRIQRIAPDGGAETAGGPGSDEGQFANPRSDTYEVDDGPWGIAVDADGNIYVADTWNHRIQKFGPDLAFISQWGTGDLFGPRDIAIDGEGNVLVVDTGNKAIRKYDSDGELIQQYGTAGTGPGEFDEPSSVSVAPNGDIYVADYWNKRIQRFNSSFQHIGDIEVESWGSHGVSDRAYIAVMEDGRVLATDPAGGRFIVIDPQGETERSWRIAAPGAGSRPIGIAFDDENVYVTDSFASSVVRIPLSVVLSAPAEPAPVETAAGTAATP